jgi:diguanylate cyclase (GGDEF)-like protein
VNSAAKPKVLVVDDMPMNIKVLSELLRPDYTVIFATDGQTGLQLAASQAPDLVVLDISMPGMRGYEVCRLLKADPVTQRIPVVFVTALDDVEDEVKGLSHGAVDYITKPFSPAIVEARIRNHIELSRAKNRLAHAYALLDLKNKELDEKNRALEIMARQDQLTKVNNRRSLEESLEAQLAHARRYGGSFALLLIDLDFFKAINDNHGHHMGDAVLVGIANLLAGFVRETDVVGRWGGEEFLMVCPETDDHVARQLAERLRAAIENRCFNQVGVVTASFGIASFRAGDDAKALLRRADKALYRAKKNGRNTVESA